MGLQTLLVATVAALIASGIEYYVATIAYPGFAIVGSREFPALHALHSERITYAIGPALLAAFGANIILLIARPRGLPVWLVLVAAISGAIVLAYTAFVAIPLHARLSGGADQAAIASLNATEWIRALATFAQAACDVALVWYALRTSASA
jgi:hypothetical protein